MDTYTNPNPNINASSGRDAHEERFAIQDLESNGKLLKLLTEGLTEYGVPYTKEHAKMLDNMVTLVNDTKRITDEEMANTENSEAYDKFLKDYTEILNGILGYIETYKVKEETSKLVQFISLVDNIIL